MEGTSLMWAQWRNPKLYVMFLADAACFALAHLVAYLIRFDFNVNGFKIRLIVSTIVYLIPLKLILFYFFGLYRGMWRYSSLGDFLRLSQACVLSSLVFASMVLFSRDYLYFSRSIIILDGLLTFVLAGSLRAAIRVLYSLSGNAQLLYDMCLPTPLGKLPQGCRKVLIVGAGNAGEKMLREIHENAELRFAPVGFLDDDPNKWGRSLHNVPILGPIGEMSRVIEDYGVQDVFISIPTATGDQMRRIVETCKGCAVNYKTLPGLSEIIDGKVAMKALRDVNYEDLLGRQPVHLDIRGICDYLDDRVVLVTGCGGSIGSELCRQMVRFKPRALILLDSSEANLFQMQMELVNEFGYHSIYPVLGRVQDRELVEGLFKRYRPHTVFHAAAYKHVPMLEKNPWEAVSNNVIGSKTVMETASAYKAERFVLVSTDKAVRPTNVMGTSKRITELILQSLQGNGTRFMAVRFGNVVGSSGSVIPLFRRQIERGGPVTVTHPDVTRYFMTIPEAARLILQAGAMGEGGEIFILKMGTPVRIADMARDLIRLSGKEPGRDIDIVFTGLREGEKLYEELISEGEGIVETGHDKIMVLRAHSNGNCHKPEELRAWLQGAIDDLRVPATRHDGPAIKEMLNRIVPEYQPQASECVL